MTERRLAWLLSARGTDMRAWPARERLDALELLRRSNGAQLVLAEALAREEEAPEGDCELFRRMQGALRRRLAPLPVALRGLSVGVLVACVMAGLYLAAAEPAELDGADPFNTAQTVSVAALDQ